MVSVQCLHVKCCNVTAMSSFEQAPASIHTFKQVTMATAGTTAVSAEVSKLTLHLHWLFYHLCTTSITTTGTTTTTTTNNNNNNNVKGNVIPVITVTTGTITESLRQYLINIPGKHEIKELKKSSHIVHCTHTSESANAKVQNIFYVRNNITCSTNCKYITAAALCVYPKQHGLFQVYNCKWPA